MQRQKGVIGNLPESLASENDSGSSDSSVVERQICWNNYIRNPVVNRNQENRTLISWSMGESSSSSSFPSPESPTRIDPKMDHDPPPIMLSFGDVSTTITHNHTSRPEWVPHNMNPSTFIGFKSPNYSGSKASTSSSDPFDPEARQFPCKRKAVELSVGQSSSGTGSSDQYSKNPFPDSSMPSNPIIPRLRLGVNVGSFEDRNVENTRRNVRIRISNTIGQSNLRSPPISISTNPENLSSNEGQPILRLPEPRRNVHLPSRWIRSSTSRANRSSNTSIPGETSRTMPEIILEHPILFPPQNAANWGVNDGGRDISGNRNLATPSRRLSEILRRSLLSPIEFDAGRGQNGNLRNVLDLIRRGEGLQSEDVMILDRSLFHGMADFYDRHRDMRLDIDNMSYEELLALEERIGNVNTGLSEQAISGCLKLKTYSAVTNQPDAEPCCICQEEYSDGDDLGSLECGHDFHTVCIKQWLNQKNLCPVCKSTVSVQTTSGK